MSESKRGYYRKGEKKNRHKNRIKEEMLKNGWTFSSHYSNSQETYEKDAPKFGTKNIVLLGPRITRVITGPYSNHINKSFNTCEIIWSDIEQLIKEAWE